MTDINTQRQIRDIQAQQSRTKTHDMTSLYLPWAQRAVNPFPLASSGGFWGESPQPWAMSVLAWYVSVFVATTNNGTNYWTLALVNSAGSTLATLATNAISANTWTRLSTTTITQPSTSNVTFSISATATLSPGSIFIVPVLECVRAG